MYERSAMVRPPPLRGRKRGTHASERKETTANRGIPLVAIEIAPRVLFGPCCAGLIGARLRLNVRNADVCNQMRNVARFIRVRRHMFLKDAKDSK